MGRPHPRLTATLMARGLRTVLGLIALAALLSWALGTALLRGELFQLLHQCGLPPLDLLDGGSSPVYDLHSGRVATLALADLRGCHKVRRPLPDTQGHLGLTVSALQ